MLDFIEKIISMDMSEYNYDYDLKTTNNSVYKELKENILQLNINELLLYLDNRGLLDYLINEINSIKYDILYDSEIHGKYHNIRVMVYTLYLVTVLNLPKEDVILLMDAAKYHDIGRIDDNVDDDHGKRSAEIIERLLKDKYSISELNLLKAVMELHSIDDNEFDNIANKYSIEDKERLRNLYSVLKDTDALDRLRLSYGYTKYSSLNPSMLRFKESLNIVKAAFQLNEYFVKNIKTRYKIILDTDIENEIDDKYALTYLLKSLETYDIEAITIAPFHDSLYSSIKPNTLDNIEEGINKGYDTVFKIMDMLNIDYKDKVFKGATGVIDRGYNENNDTVNKIIEVCNKNDSTYILAIAGLTNIALAIRKDPNIASKMKLIWLGGNSFLYNKNDEFNFIQDLQATKEVFEKVDDLTVIPCVNVASTLVTTIYELEHYLDNNDEIDKYLLNEFRRCKPQKDGNSKTIWDIAVIAYLINKGWFEEDIVNRPSINEDGTYTLDSKDERKTTFVKRISRDRIFRDFFRKM